MPAAPDKAPPPKPAGRFSWLQTPKGRAAAGVLGVVLLAAAALAVPAVRYKTVGAFVKKSASLQVTDSETGKPVSKALVAIDGQLETTDSNGRVQYGKLGYGPHNATVTKKHYRSADATIKVPLTGSTSNTTVKLKATGRQVAVKAVNKITGKPLAKAELTAADSSVLTDDKGEASIVLPASASTTKGTVKLGGYNDLAVELKNASADPANTFSLVPAGKVYFLSKRTGVINVMKSDLDGSNASVVLAGTGNEMDHDTVLQASRDWKYLALKAKRDSAKAKLYLIDTSSDQLSVIDEGNMDIRALGWHNEYFIYHVEREVKSWEPRKNSLKSYNAKMRRLIVIDETAAAGNSDYNYVQEYLAEVEIHENEVLYVKNLRGPTYMYVGLEDKTNVVYSSRPDGANKRTIKEFPAGQSRWVSMYRRGTEVFVQNYNGGAEGYFRYVKGTFVAAQASEYSSVRARDILESPSSQQTFWSETRDGKFSLFIGNADAGDGKEIASLSTYSPYGWYSDEYILVSKGGSELFIATKETMSKPLKITDYHRPDGGFQYGHGYGGGQ